MKNKLLLFLIIVWSASLSGCRKDATDSVIKPHENSDDIDPTPFASDSVDVLIAGAVGGTDGFWNACYWLNDSLHVVDHSSIANDIATIGDEVVLAGKFQGKACYWRNGIRTILDENSPGEVKAIGVNNGEIYLVGELHTTQTNFQAFVWKQGKMTFLNNYKGGAVAIDFQGSNVYIAGTDLEKPCYWENGKITSLSEHFGHVYGIQVSGEDVFVCGDYRPEGDGNFLAGYWKNGKFHSPTTNSCYLWNIGLRKEQVFLVGSSVRNDIADNAVLINGTEKVLLATPHGALSGANDIAMTDHHEYVLGSYTDASAQNHYSLACYWRDKQLHKLCKQKSLGTSIRLR